MRPRLGLSARKVTASDDEIGHTSGLTAPYLLISYSVIIVKLEALTTPKPAHLKERLIKTKKLNKMKRGRRTMLTV